MSIKVTKKLDVIIMSPFAFLIRVYSEGSWKNGEKHWYITYSRSDIRKVEKGEGANLNRLDTLEPICLRGIKYKSGETQEMFSSGGESRFDETEENYTESLCFDKIVDVDNLQSLLFG